MIGTYHRIVYYYNYLGLFKVLIKFSICQFKNGTQISKSQNNSRYKLTIYMDESKHIFVILYTLLWMYLSFARFQASCLNSGGVFRVAI